MGSGKTATFRLISCRAVIGHGKPIEYWPYKLTAEEKIIPITPTVTDRVCDHQYREGGFFGSRKALDNAIARAKKIRGERWPYHQLKIVSIWKETEII